MAAGRGERLRPATTVPKALTSIGKEPLLSRLVRQLRAGGVERIIVVTRDDPSTAPLFGREARRLGIEHARTATPGSDPWVHLRETVPRIDADTAFVCNANCLTAWRSAEIHELSTSSGKSVIATRSCVEPSHTRIYSDADGIDVRIEAGPIAPGSSTADAMSYLGYGSFWLSDLALIARDPSVASFAGMLRKLGVSDRLQVAYDPDAPFLSLSYPENHSRISEFVANLVSEDQVPPDWPDPSRLPGRESCAAPAPDKATWL